jgi:hypothetical protein
MTPIIMKNAVIDFKFKKQNILGRVRIVSVFYESMYHIYSYVSLNGSIGLEFFQR